MVDLSPWTNITGIEGLLSAPNEVTNDVWGIMIFALIYIVLFVTLTIASSRAGSPEPEKESFLASSIIAAVISYLLATVEIIIPELTIIPTVLSVVAIIVIARKNS